MSTKLSSCLPDFPLGSALTDSLTKQMASPHPNFPFSVLDINRRRTPGEAGARSCTPANARFECDASELMLMLVGCCYSIAAALRRALLTSSSLMRGTPGPRWATPSHTFSPPHFFPGLFLPAREARMAAKAPSQLPLYKEADKQTASPPPSATAHEERGCYCGACCDIGNSS